MRRWHRLALLALVVVICAPGAVRLDRHPWRKAIEVRTEHFVVETNVFPEVARSLAERLESSYALFADRFGPLDRHAARRMRVALYRTADEYLTKGDGVRGAVGHFDAALDRCALAWRGGVGETGWPIAVHEASHHYFRRRFPRVTTPSWYSEGVACYFEGLQDPTTKRGIARTRVRGARVALAEDRASLDALLKARARVVDGGLRIETFAPVRYYALSWSLIHFLATDPRYRHRFRRFEARLFATTARGTSREDHARELLLAECGPLDRLERDWHAHIRGLSRPEAPPRPRVYAWELSARSPWVRFHALHRLSRGPLPADLRRGVVKLLDDPDVIVRTAAVTLLQRRVDRTVAARLLENLDAGDALLRREALRALATPAAAVAVPRLLAEREDRVLALEALVAIGDPRARGTLRLAVLDSLFPDVLRARCANALADDPESLSTLRLATSDRSAIVRSAARAALRRTARDTVQMSMRGIPARRRGDLLHTLGDAGAALADRVAACEELARAREARAVPRLRRLCAAGHADALRLAAVRALVRITGETRGFRPGQRAREREAALRRWADG